ncbi:MAG: amidase [Acidiferrobacteraceae bacterium]|nr:amidase [Acidiferrobacteraceae bacterium]MDP6398189.1 amidase family protein [Arenicellales bacterium]MDP6552804.1 amidase family protein [Arenicellales bacterium]MDP6792119.1 amidase family protein [Arenicellales bacterium]MDP6919920.1 amidase family protein [Arenicellales bacterium]
MTHELISLPAHAVRTLLQDRQVSPLDLLDALEIRIGEVDPAVNALPTLCFERARARARERDFSTLPLAGMPIVIKDLLTVSGVRTTFGSMAYRDHVPQASDLLVERIEAAGGIVYAKSNTPEFGAGANTFNDVFGFTRNPWNTALSAAGSSGGSAVALATGMAWLATGSDLGGSLRNPASFCAVVGLRPSQGRVAADPGELAFNRLSMEGPMARNVTDAAMLLDVMAGYDSRDPMSLDDPSESFENAARQKNVPQRIAFSPDLGITPVDPEVARICEQAAERFEELGARVEKTHPDFSDLQEVFQVHRALSYAASLGPELEENREVFKPEIIWNVEKGLSLTAQEIMDAMVARSQIYQRTVEFFSKFDLILTPATVVPPYPVEQRFVERIGDHKFSNYIEWCSITYAFSVIGAPAISIPCGFTQKGLPVGLQIAAPVRQEARLLSAACTFENLLRLSEQLPIDPRAPDP